jgi:hypothetical protein
MSLLKKDKDKLVKEVFGDLLEKEDKGTAKVILKMIDADIELMAIREVQYSPQELHVMANLVKSHIFNLSSVLDLIENG